MSTTAETVDVGNGTKRAKRPHFHFVPSVKNCVWVSIC